mgnify:CR=1 FL=1
MNKKKVLVIGGTSGIGLSLSKLFAKENYNVIVASSNTNNLEKTLAELKKINDNCSYIKCDLTIEKDVENLIQTISEQGENLECVVLSSCKGLFGKIDEINNKQFLNYFQTFVVSYLKILKNIFNNHNKKTRIIYLSSYVAHFDIPNYNAYSFVKSTIDNFLEKIRVENKNGRILTVYPGSVDTDFDEKSEKVGHFRIRKSKNKKPAYVVAKKIFQSYGNYKNILHTNTLMNFLFFLKNIFPKLLNHIFKSFFN